MGIFSDMCQTCGARVKKRARFCSMCKSPAPKGWIKCGQCDKWVGVESKFCPHCNNTMHPEEVELIAGDRLLRKSGLFVQRLDVDNFKTRIKKKFILEEGQKAIIMRDGKVVTTISPGSHDIKSSGLVDLLFGSHPATMFIVDGGEIVLPFRLEDLMSKDDFELKAYLEVVFKFDDDNAAEFVANVLKGKRQLTIDEIKLFMERSIYQAVKEVANSTIIDDLVTNPDARMLVQKKLDDATMQACSSLGLKLFRVSEVDFYGPTYNKLRQLNGEAEVKCRQVVIQKRFIDAEKQHEMDRFKNQTDLATYKELLQHEANLQTLDLQHTETMLGLRQQNEAEDVKLDGELSRDEARHQHNLDKKLSTERVEMKVADEWLDVKKKKRVAEREDRSENLKIEREHIGDLLETYAKYTPMQLIAVLDPAKADQVLRMRELEIREKQIAGDAKIKQLEEIHAAREQLAKEKEQLLTDFADRTERRMDKDVSAMSEIAGKAGTVNNYNR